MTGKTLKERANKNQSLGKFSFITAATLLIPAGITVAGNGDTWLGFGLIVFGIGCLGAREYIKIKE